MKHTFCMEIPPSGNLGEVYAGTKKNYILPAGFIVLFAWFAWEIVSTYLSGGYFVDAITGTKKLPVTMFLLAGCSGFSAVLFFNIARKQQTITVCKYGIAMGNERYPYAELRQISITVVDVPRVNVEKTNGMRAQVITLSLTKQVKAALEEAAAFVELQQAPR